MLYRAACNDGVDNDGDTLVDLADPGCVGNAWRNFEAPPPRGCGFLGIEPALVLAALRARRRVAIR